MREDFIYGSERNPLFLARLAVATCARALLEAPQVSTLSPKWTRNFPNLLGVCTGMRSIKRSSQRSALAPLWLYCCVIGVVIGCASSWSCGGSGASSVTAPTPASNFSCPLGLDDMMEYFVMAQPNRETQFMSGTPNPLYTQVFPDLDFAPSGYWFWLKSPTAHGFDVDAFDQNYVYLRSTELVWSDNTTFKRKHKDVPIAARCVAPNAPGPEIQVANTQIDWYASCMLYKTSTLGTIANNLDPPVLMDTGGNIGQIMTRVLHYQYNCNSNFQNCGDEEQFFLGLRYGQWQWKHYQNGTLVQTTLINNIVSGIPTGTLPCANSYQQ
jgi:hypothetical protein